VTGNYPILTDSKQDTFEPRHDYDYAVRTHNTVSSPLTTTITIHSNIIGLQPVSWSVGDRYYLKNCTIDSGRSSVLTHKMNTDIYMSFLNVKGT